MIRMWDLSGMVRSGHDADATCVRVAGTERDPGGDMFVGRQAEIRAVLMPWDAIGRAFRLPPHRRVEDHDVGPDQVLDRVEDCRLAHHGGGPRGKEKWVYAGRNGRG